MSNNTKTISAGGTSTLGLLGVVFITLKLCGVINWSWLWVLCPFWIGLAIIAGVLGVIVISALAIGIVLFTIWSINKIRDK